MTLPVEPEAAAAQCSVCQAPASGKFCSNCGSPLAGATCAACAAPLSVGAKFCHRCGTPARAGAAGAPGSMSNALPWAVAGIAFIALIALVAGQRFRATRADPAGAPTAVSERSATTGLPPDISSLTPAEAAVRLYDRIMGAHERGQEDTVRIFAPMAIAAYQMLPALDLDQRYDLGRVGALSGDSSLARAEADTILAASPTHLLGLILAANAAHLRKDTAAERAFRGRLVAAATAERAKQLPEYLTHATDITVALDLARRP